MKLGRGLDTGHILSFYEPSMLFRSVYGAQEWDTRLLLGVLLSEKGGYEAQNMLGYSSPPCQVSGIKQTEPRFLTCECSMPVVADQLTVQ